MVPKVMLTFKIKGKLDSHKCCDCDQCCGPNECRDCYECCDSEEGCDSDECGDSVTEQHDEHHTHLCAVDISSANDFGFPPVKASSMAFRLAEA